MPPLSEGGGALRIVGLDLTQAAQWTVADRLLPDLSWVIGHGPARAHAILSVEDREMDVTLTYRFEYRNPISALASIFGWGEVRETTVVVSPPPASVAPSRYVATAVGASTPAAGTAGGETVPLLGLARVTVTATGRADGEVIAVDTVARSTPIVPWSEILGLFALLLAYRLGAASARWRVRAEDAWRLRPLTTFAPRDWQGRTFE